MRDSEIVELYFQRRETAVLETDRKYRAFLCKIAHNILRDMRDTEEIINDTYMGAWNAIPPTRPDSLKYFLARITRNLSFDRLDYKNAAKRYALFVEIDECIPDCKYDMENMLEAKEIGMTLNRYLKTLDNRDCAIFLSRYFYCHSINEIARQYALPARRVKYILSKMRSNLKIWFEKEGVAI